MHTCMTDADAGEGGAREAIKQIAEVKRIGLIFRSWVGMGVS